LPYPFHAENGRLISRIRARRTCAHWDGRQPTGLSGRGFRHAIDTNGSPRPWSQREEELSREMAVSATEIRNRPENLPVIVNSWCDISIRCGTGRERWKECYFGACPRMRGSGTADEKQLTPRQPD